jgi:S-adenosylmethionine/arginine decarboxylase-like enzyme
VVEARRAYLPRIYPKSVLFDTLVAGLNCIRSGAAGISFRRRNTGLVLFAESHLAVHSFPEHGSLTLNLFCCRPGEWNFRES